MPRQIFLYIGFLILLTGCQKFLDKKANKSSFIVSNLAELQGLFDSENTYTQNPSSGLLAGDDGYYTSQNFNAIFSQVIKDTYLWKTDADLSKDWALCYEKIFKMNVILEEIEELAKDGNDKSVLQLKGSALFVRALAHFEAARLFAPYASIDGPDNEFGIPLKLKADIESTTSRATLKESYKTIIDDLNLCLQMLPDTGMVKTRPGKNAAYGLLAKIYLDQGDYERSERYADSSLLIYKYLMDYNNSSEVDQNSTIPFRILNREVIYHATSTYGNDMRNFYVDSGLISLYDVNDIRKNAFFERPNTTTYRFKGSYSGTNITVSFTGLSTNEVFLIRSESKARNGNLSGAIQDLNNLLINRWRTGRFVPLVASNLDDALKYILSERRKELCFRPGTRWADLRRLNKDPKYATTLIRIVNGIRYELPSNDNRYTFMIPVNVVAQTQIVQNPR